jgi:hypothetical protein
MTNGTKLAGDRMALHQLLKEHWRDHPSGCTVTFDRSSSPR